MTKLKLLAATAMTSLVCGLLVVAYAQTEVKPSDTAAYYTAKCVMCHGKKAEKKVDLSLPDDQLVDLVLKGKKAEKPPNMPAYAEKGVSADDAKALVAHMKALKAAP